MLRHMSAVRNKATKNDKIKINKVRSKNNFVEGAKWVNHGLVLKKEAHNINVTRGTLCIACKQSEI